jgi:hypothetical protein
VVVVPGYPVTCRVSGRYENRVYGWALKTIFSSSGAALSRAAIVAFDQKMRRTGW